MSSLPPIPGAGHSSVSQASSASKPPTHGKSPRAKSGWGDVSSLPLVSASDIKQSGSRLTPPSPASGSHFPSISRGATPSPKSADASPLTSSSPSPRSSPALRNLSGSSSFDRDKEIDSDSESVVFAPISPAKKIIKPIGLLPPLPFAAARADADPVFAPRQEPPKAPTIKPMEPAVEILDLDTLKTLSFELTDPEAPVIGAGSASEKMVRKCVISDIDDTVASNPPSTSLQSSAFFTFTKV